MPRANRVLSFITQWGGSNPPHDQRDSPTTGNSPQLPSHPSPTHESSSPTLATDHTISNGTSASHPPPTSNPTAASPVNGVNGRPRGESDASKKSQSRRNSMASAYQPPLMEIGEDTPAELQPVFSFLNRHGNKLYQEGYFLKLHDLDSRGRPSADRIWNECFAQLVGTVLSLWDAAQLDAAGEDGEVVPTFVNLTDASIKMIESLPMNGIDGQSLQNVLSISTAANNRYLLHFNSLHSLTQWTAGIRLAIFEHAILQEAYTGSILAGKGKHLNSIKSIMERARFPTEDWARVRFGAGTPWRRCWCVISPPDEKELQKAQKNMKKKSAYDKSTPVIKGDIKFYDTRKINKKTRPIATISDAFAAYAIYPQAKPLIDQSTLVKVEGMITIHSTPETTTEGFIFVMPEVHPAISGFEMMLRWLMPTFDTFALYGRPNRLIADAFDTRSLMFAMPSNRRYGYLELIDVAGLIHTEGSSNWNEREWRKQLKILTSKRITSGQTSASRSGSDIAHRRNSSRSSLHLQGPASRSSFNLPSSSRGAVKFGDGSGTGRSAPGSRQGSPAHDGGFNHPQRVDTAPQSSSRYGSPHRRAASDKMPSRRGESSRLSYEAQAEDPPPLPPPHGASPGPAQPYERSPTRQWRNPDENNHSPGGYRQREDSMASVNGYVPGTKIENITNNKLAPYNPVAAPPAMAHRGGQRPPVKPNAMPDLRRANSAIDAATLAQLAEANRAGRARSASGSKDDDSPYTQQPPPGATVMAPMGNPNYGAPNNYHGPPPGQYQGQYQSNQMRGPAPGSNPYQNQRGPPPPSHGGRGLAPGTLPTIPGTPAYEQGNFDLPVQTREPSVGSVKRKPLPDRSPSYGSGPGQGQGQYQAYGRG